MAAGNSLSGRLGEAVVGSTAIARITEWSVNPTLATSSEWGDSDSSGFTNRLPGRKDATATCAGKYDTGDEVVDVFQPEDVAILTLWLTSSGSEMYWDFPSALCTDFSLSVNVDTEEVIGWTSSWGADGVFHYPGEAGIATGRTSPY